MGTAFKAKFVEKDLFELVIAYAKSPKSQQRFARECWIRLLVGPAWSRNVFFDLLTYRGGGISGSISPSEDILDRVIAFIV